MSERGYEDEGNGNDGKEMYNEEEYLAEVGELNCYCVPSRVYGMKDFFFRTLAWFLLNKEQIFGGFTGTFCIVRGMMVIDWHIFFPRGGVSTKSYSPYTFLRFCHK